jgi:hypothetical protein
LDCRQGAAFFPAAATAATVSCHGLLLVLPARTRASNRRRNTLSADAAGL